MQTTTGSGPAASFEALASVASGSTYVNLVGQPGLREHNVGDLFRLSSQTLVGSLTAAGNTVFADEIGTVQEFNNGLTTHGAITGGVTFFGHSVQGQNLTQSMLAPGQNSGSDTNVWSGNVNLLSNAQLGPNATVTLNACNAGLYPLNKPQNHSIAQLIANQLQRPVYAWRVGLFFSNNLTTKFPSTKHPPVGTTPVYMLPLGGIGLKPCLLKPDQPEPEHCGGWE